jgi:pseudouridine-5'-phosphate glycosidase
MFRSLQISRISLQRLGSHVTAKTRLNGHRSVSGLVISPEVRDALDKQLPIVALESTIITHGMPFPQNIEVARKVEDTVRASGAVPATIAIIDGAFKVGLEAGDFSRLGDLTNKDNKDATTKIFKASRRDLAHIAAKKLTAGTTVSATMILAHMAGIRVFATGGIGGVHRGVEATMDISADLFELEKTPVCVVCAGAKSILDIPKTLEVLESHGVPTVGYKTDTFPAFYTTSSGVKVPIRADSPTEIAQLMYNQMDWLNLNAGIVVGVPNPEPVGNEAEVEALIAETVIEAAEAGITGAAITPHLLGVLEKSTDGDTLRANVALVLNNAAIASQIASEYISLKTTTSRFVPKSQEPTIVKSNKMPSSTASSAATQTPPTAATLSNDREGGIEFIIPSRNMEYPPIVIVGGAVVDTISTSSVKIDINTSNPGVTHSSFGGVGRNIAEGIARLVPSSLTRTVSLVSAVADDGAGMGLLKHAASIGVDVSHMLRVCQQDGSIKDFTSDRTIHARAIAHSQPKLLDVPNTATYTAIHDVNGDLAVGIADMRIFTVLDPTYIQRLAGLIRSSRIVITDGNITPETLGAVAAMCVSNQIPLMFEPTSKFKCRLPLAANCIHQVGMDGHCVIGVCSNAIIYVTHRLIS